MYKIGFIDYYLSEWHANNYPAWIKQVCDETGLDYKVSYAYAEKDVSPVDGVTTDEWCKKYGVEKCETIAELCKKSDYVIILAPTNPETHLRLCKSAFEANPGARMYIDKTFAPDYKTAKEIFALAEKYDIRFFSTSSLRYCADYDNLTDVESISTYYGGSNIEEYIIHQIESVVKVMAAAIKRVKAEQNGDDTDFDLEFADGRHAYMHFNVNNGYRAAIKFKNGEVIDKSLTPGYFPRLTKKILEFFQNGTTDFDNSETLEVMKIRDAVLEAKDKTGVWFEL